MKYGIGYMKMLKRFARFYWLSGVSVHLGSGSDKQERA
jgi:hypothetical protein